MYIYPTQWQDILKEVGNIESRDQLKKVAERCSRYNPREESQELKSSTASSQDNTESCTNCTHYNNEGRCNLDLIDPILSSLAMETDLKS